ncbi:MAG: hypothetical protein LBG92_04205 [Prevotellaceae bacterium]|jgi:hypothetical protein|nr:hypothetical protein [Prevotellaceae bacterium]
MIYGNIPRRSVKKTRQHIIFSVNEKNNVKVNISVTDECRGKGLSTKVFDSISSLENDSF